MLYRPCIPRHFIIDFKVLCLSYSRYERSPAYLTLNRLKKRAKEKEEPIDYDKPHFFKTHNFKGLNWCEFCGNFLWGFTAQGVKCDGNNI